MWGSGRTAAWLVCAGATAVGCTNDGCGSVPEPSLDVGESAPITLSYADGWWMPIVFDDIWWAEPDVDPPPGTGELDGTLTLVDTWAEDLVGRIEVAVPDQPTLVLRGSPNTCE